MGKYKSSIHTEQSVQRALYQYFGKRKMKYMLSSAYIYDWRSKGWKSGYRWESDFFFIDKGMMSWEIEIKVDRQDFSRNEKKKVKKHQALLETFESGNPNDFFVPNHFYYCAPAGMIGLDEIEDYAGLMEIDDNHKLSFVSEQVEVHDKVDDERMLNRLLDKFYKKALRDEKMFIDYMVAVHDAGSDENKKNEAYKTYIRKKRI